MNRVDKVGRERERERFCVCNRKRKGLENGEKTFKMLTVTHLHMKDRVCEPILHR